MEFVMANLPWSRSEKDLAVRFQPLDHNAGFLLDVEGYRVVALKMPSSVDGEITGLWSVLSSVIPTRLKSIAGHNDETSRQWLIVTSMQNAMLKDYDRFTALVAQGLTKASGVTVTTSDLILSSNTATTRMEKKTDLLATT